MVKKAIGGSKVKFHAKGEALWKVEELIPYPGNAKKHTDEQIDNIAKSFLRDGYHTPISIDEDGVIITGHGRRLAAIKLGLTEIPVTIVRGKTDSEKREMRLKDNTIARGEIDLSIMSDEFDFIKSADSSVNIEDFAFNETELEIVGVDIDNLLESLESQDDSEDGDDALREVNAPEDVSPYKHSRTHDEEGHSVKYPVIINCRNQDEQNLVHQFAKEHDLKCNLK